VAFWKCIRKQHYHKHSLSRNTHWSVLGTFLNLDGRHQELTFLPEFFPNSGISIDVSEGRGEAKLGGKRDCLESGGADRGTSSGERDGHTFSVDDASSVCA
jgi:hypothetical protein